MSTETNATVDRTKCSPLCGTTKLEFYSGNQLFGAEYGGGYGDAKPADLGGKVYCSSACRNSAFAPISAAPPPAKAPEYVERRAGQRWRLVRTDGARPREGVLGTRKNDGRSLVGEPIDYFTDFCWHSDFCTMTLLSDAPKAGKPTAPQWESFCRPFLRCKYCTTEVAPSAQEAPKAVPVQPRCAWSHISACGGEKLLRHVRQADRSSAMRWCEKHYLESEARFAKATGTPYTGHERLPRPTLAVDWTWDCLPEAGR